MDEIKEYVSMEALEKYHKKLIEYINMRDALLLNGRANCMNCGAIITDYKCDNCGMKIIEPGS